jgi:hypothetical protein
MPLPSLYVSGDKARAWSIARAAAHGAVLGALAGIFKTLGPLREVSPLSGQPSEKFLAGIPEIAGAALGFALLCAFVTTVRNAIARRFVGRDFR